MASSGISYQAFPTTDNRNRVRHQTKVVVPTKMSSQNPSWVDSGQDGVGQKSCLRLPFRQSKEDIPKMEKSKIENAARVQQEQNQASVNQSHTFATSRSTTGGRGLSAVQEGDEEEAAPAQLQSTRRRAQTLETTPYSNQTPLVSKQPQVAPINFLQLLTPPTPMDRRTRMRQHIAASSPASPKVPLAFSSPDRGRSKNNNAPIPAMKNNVAVPASTSQPIRGSRTKSSKPSPIHLLTPPIPIDRRPGHQKSSSLDSSTGLNAESTTHTPTRSNSSRSRERGLYHGEIEPSGYRGEVLKVSSATLAESNELRNMTGSIPLKISQSQSKLRSKSKSQSQQQSIVSPLTPDPAFWDSNNGWRIDERQPSSLSPYEGVPVLTPQKQPTRQQAPEAPCPVSPSLSTSTRSSVNINRMMPDLQPSPASNRSRPSTSSSSQRNHLQNYQKPNISKPPSPSRQRYTESKVSRAAPPVEVQQKMLQKDDWQHPPSKMRAQTRASSKNSVRSRSVSSVRSVSSTKSATSSTASSTKSGSRRRDPQQGRYDKLNVLAAGHADEGEYEQAVLLLKHVLQFNKETYGDKHPRSASTHHNLGVVYSKKAFVLGQDDECIDLALAHFQTAARSARDCLGPNHQNVAASLTKMGLLLLKEQSEQNALQCFEEALRIRVVVFGPRHELVANVLNNMGVCFLHLGDFEESRKRLEQARDVQKLLLRSAVDDQASNSEGASVAPYDEIRSRQLELADTLCNMGGLYLENEAPLEAVKPFSEALQIRVEIMGREDPLVIQTRALYDMARSKSSGEEARNRSFSLFGHASPDAAVESSPVTEKRRADPPTDLNLSLEVLDDSASGYMKSRRTAPIPFSEIVLDDVSEQKEEKSVDSIGEDFPRRDPHGSTKIWVSPLTISWSPSRKSGGANANGSKLLSNPPNQGSSLDRYLGAYQAEESCMIDKCGHLSPFNPFPNKGDTAPRHQIMVIQPSLTEQEHVVRPLVSRKTTSWAKAVNKESEGKYGDSPSLKLKADDSMYDFDGDSAFSDSAEVDSGLAPIAGKQLSTDSDKHVLTREMVQNPSNHLGEIYHAASVNLKKCKLNEAIYLFETILRCQRKKYGNLHEEVGAALHNVGIAYLRAERHTDAVDTFGKAVRVRKGALGNDHPDVAVSLVKAGICNLLLHRFDVALVVFREALSVRRHSLGALHPSLARVYNNIGCVHVEFNDISQARRAFEGALDIQRNALCHEPDNGPLMFGVATTLSNLGYLYSSQEQYGKAALVMKEALSFQEQVLGYIHSTVLSTMDNLADACAKSSEGGLALKCYNEILCRFETLDEAGTGVEGEQYNRRRRAEAVIFYKMSRINRQQNDKGAELEKLRAALRAIRAIIENSELEDTEASKRLERGIRNEVEQLEMELRKSGNIEWL